MATNDQVTGQKELFGHPTGLFTLFFAEMWERFSYYGMRALLVFYMLKGFLGFGDSDAYAVYGAYTALVYMTPFFGGMLADRLLGQRRAVILGGLLMGLGHLTMTFENEPVFFLALGLLIAGNGFFKPNISTMVGSLYPEGSPKRDGGFTIFYMGINLGAALAPLLCGYVGETYGWHYGFGLATIGMFIGVAVFWAPTRLAQSLILAGAVLTAVGMIYLQRDSHVVLLVLYGLVGVALVIAGFISFRALGQGGLPDWAGQPPHPEKLKAKGPCGISNEMAVYVGTVLGVLVLSGLVWGTLSTSIIPADTIAGLKSEGGFMNVVATFLGEIAKPAGLVLTIAGLLALVFLVKETVKMDRVPRERMYVVLILTFFSLLFWSFFEQAGSSINNFTDRNVDRVFESEGVTEDDIGQEVELILTQSVLGYSHPALGQVTKKLEEMRDAKWAAESQGKSESELEELEVKLEVNPRADLLPAAGNEQLFVDMASKLFDKKDPADKDFDTSRMLTITKGSASQSFGGDVISLDKLDGARDEARRRKITLDDVKITFQVDASHVGMARASYGQEIPASTFQSVNPIFIMLFGLLFTAAWAMLAARGMEPSTPVKFALGLAQLGLGFGALWMGAQGATDMGMVNISWLVLGYLLHTTGELCLSPVGLSAMTKLSPSRLVSTVMGAWFLATAFSNLVAAIIAQFTGVTHGGDASIIPAPKDTVNTYGDVFGTVAVAALICAAICFILSPKLKAWMHEGVEA